MSGVPTHRLGTVENTHRRITEKISLLQTVAAALDPTGAGGIGERLAEISGDYGLSVVDTLAEYYEADGDRLRTSDLTIQYYRALASGNFDASLAALAARLRRMAGPRAPTVAVERALSQAEAIVIDEIIERKEKSQCECGGRMNIMPELNELHCINAACGRIRRLAGVICHDERQTQDQSKPKSSGHNPNRYFNTWIKQLQAKEVVNLPDSTLEAIEYVIARDGYDKRILNCEDMRRILRDPRVIGGTKLNEHIPWLIKAVGGPRPPQLGFNDVQRLSMKFDRIMRLHEQLYPDGNKKPYYPDIIRRAVESEFDGDDEKLRIIDYIHMQSRETIIKNDKEFKGICEIADPEDGLVYRPTDPARRWVLGWAGK